MCAPASCDLLVVLDAPTAVQEGQRCLLLLCPPPHRALGDRFAAQLGVSDLVVQAGAAGGAAAVLALAAAGLCAALARRRRAAEALAAKARAEQAGVALGSFPPDGEHPLEAPGPGQRGLWFYEQLHASLVRTQGGHVRIMTAREQLRHVSTAARALGGQHFKCGV